jgi:hypothetical protein
VCLYIRLCRRIDETPRRRSEEFKVNMIWLRCFKNYFNLRSLHSHQADIISRGINLSNGKNELIDKK